MERSVKEYLLDLFFPRTCPVCGEIVLPKGELICPACRSRLSYVGSLRCMKCGKRILSDRKEYCPDCAAKHRSFEKGIILADYNPEMRRALSDVKYHNIRQNLDFFAEEIIRLRGTEMTSWQAEALIPVPLHPARRRERGFNQAEELAKRLSAGLDIPVDGKLLFRTKKTAPQKELTDRQRLANLVQAFAAEARQTPYRRVILVDDIYTTGSTAEACTRALQAAGVNKVYLVCIAAGVGR